MGSWPSSDTAAPSGPAWLHGVASSEDCRAWLASVEAALDAAARTAGDGAPRPCSLRLRELPAVLSSALATLAAHGPLRMRVEAILGAPAALLVDQCWVRHQPAPRARRGAQSPHAWHQDGALGFDFLAAGPTPPRDALLRMAVCWLPLVDCGADAPSLAWVDAAAAPLDRLLPLAALADDAAAQAGAAAFSNARDRPAARHDPLPAVRHAELSAGDALLFDGALLHRTHADDAMTRPRSSIELRWLPAGALPARLHGERLGDAWALDGTGVTGTA
jgi:hypothetical protein